MHKCMNEWVKGGRALGSMSVSYYNELWLWGSHLTINNLKMGRFTTACLPHTLVSKIKVLYLQQCFENHQALYEYAIPWLNTILCETWWHQHLIPIITPNWQWSWEKRHQKVLHLFNSFFFFLMYQYDLVCFSDGLGWPLSHYQHELHIRWAQPRSFL